MKKILLFFLSMSLASHATGAQTDSLHEYRPRVWWHWMNGNITHEGIRKDIEWMDKSGIAGFHLFDAGCEAPQIVDERLVYMSEGWKREFNFALDLADSLGMEVTITSSPGWSITGGPWVSKDDAMKKLVWSETVIQGGRSYRDSLPQPPQTCGFYQNLLQYPNDPHRYDFYQDVAVIAVKIPDTDLTMAQMGAILSTSDCTDPSVLIDGQLTGTLEIAPGNPAPDNSTDGYAWVQISFDRPRTIKAYMESIDYSERRNQARRLEYSIDGKYFIPIISRDPESPTHVCIYDIPPTTARFFRFISNIPGKKLKYSELALFGVTKVNAATEKAGFFASRTLRDFYPTPPTYDAVSEVIDLSSRYKGGVLDWKIPAGRWRIYRFGYNLTGKRNGPATPEATGLEVDKLDKEAVMRYYRNYFKMYDEASGGRLGSTISHLMIDSYEARCQNWTAHMPDIFESRRGYSLLRWLPALAGEVLESADRTERFLNDWRRTIEELMAEAHYDAADVVLDEYGMKRHSEAHEYSRVYNADGMDVRKNADVPMAAFWMREFYSSYPCEEADMREAASVAHIYGQNVVGSESFTTNGEDPDGYGRRRAWTHHPGNLKSAADAAMASGLTRFIIHSCVHQPVEDRFPGLTLGKHGMAFNRHNTWADEARPWTDYLSRSSRLLSQGIFAADVAVYYSETTNAVARFNYERPLVPEGHAYDFVNRTMIADGILKLEGDHLVTDSGMSYRILVLDREVKYMSLPVLRRIAEFAKAGVVIVGERPCSCFGLGDSEAEFNALVEDIWGCGRFNVLHPSQMERALPAMMIAPDVSFLNPTGADIRFVHRHLEDGELYWIANINPEYRTLDVSFNVHGLKPHIYHADTDSWEEAAYRMEEGRTVVTLILVPDDAQFVLFEGSTSIISNSVPNESYRAVAVLGTDWKVSFQKGRGAPESLTLDKLSRLDESDVLGVKYFSGTASYRCSFEFYPLDGTSGYRLDLGEVHDMAHVFLNGKDMGLVWKEPYAVDITDAVVPGSNQLEIRVTNTWHNRIIGDLQPDAGEKVTYTSYKFYEADSPLRESGLVGPVQIWIKE